MTLVGGAAEFTALGLVVWDFYDARNKADALVRTRDLLDLTLPEPNTPEEAELRRKQDQFYDLVMQTTSPTRRDLHVVAIGSEELRERFADSLRGSTTRKWWSIGLLAVGIGFSMAANLI